jgi:hypothetical protein
MSKKPRTRSALRWVGAAAGLAAGVYAANVAISWFRYGNPSRPGADGQDELLDRFMPAYDVVERHHMRVAAPAAVTLAAAREMDLSEPLVARAIFRAREVILGAAPDDRLRPHGLLAAVQSLGWVVLEEVPGREIVAGAVTKPWQANVTFRSIPPNEFLAFAEPDYVKIVWTLRADPIDATNSIFRTETRAVSTDAGARAKFRAYWSFLSPGIRLIRWSMLRPLRAEAEARVRGGG